LTDAPVPDATPLPGRFVLPRLADSHCHLTLGCRAAGPFAVDRDQAETTLRQPG
jgi:predicted amidohydrolase YtcJ